MLLLSVFLFQLRTPTLSTLKKKNVLKKTTQLYTPRNEKIKNKLSPKLSREENKVRAETNKIEAIITIEKSMKLHAGFLKR